MKKLIQAITELLEAKAELLREEACMLHLGKYAEGYKAGQADMRGCDCGCDEGIEFNLTDETDDNG